MNKKIIKWLIKHYQLQVNYKYHINEELMSRLHKLYFVIREGVKISDWAYLRKDATGYYYLEFENGPTIMLFDLTDGRGNSDKFKNEIYIEFIKSNSRFKKVETKFVANHTFPFYWLTDNNFDGLKYILNNIDRYQYVPSPDAYARQLNIFDFGVDKV